MVNPVKKTPTARRAGNRLPETVDDATIQRVVAETEAGIPAGKLRRRGRPPIGEEASSTYSVRLPDDLVTLARRTVRVGRRESRRDDP